MARIVFFYVISGGFVIADKAPSGSESLQVALVDGKTGDILWTNSTSDTYSGYIPPNFGKTAIKELIDDLFKDFPNKGAMNRIP